MAAALFTRELPGRELSGSEEENSTSSAGLLPGGEPVPPEVLEVMAPFGIDLSGHVSRPLTRTLIGEADLVVGMGRRHVREAVLLEPGCWPRAFTLKELVQRGRELGPRETSSELASWLDAVHEGRTRSELAHRSTADEVADPYGGPLGAYRAAAEELATLTADLAGLLWPAGREQIDAAGG